MRITKVEAFLMSYPLPEAIRLPFHGGERTILKRDAMLVRVTTDTGLTGWGPGPGSVKVHQAICDSIGPFLEGRVLMDPDALRVQYSAGPGDTDDLRKAYCVVEVALYDLLGKSLGLPISELLGGRVRDRIRLYGSAGMYQSPVGYAEEAARIAGLGFRAYKMRPGIGPEQDLEAVRLMRKATGAGFDLMVDAHSWWRMGDKSYSKQTVHQLAEEIGKYDAAWLEEPLPPLDHEAYRELHEKDYVPLATGEHESGEDGYMDLIQTGAADYLQMDVCCQGGFAMGRRLIAEISHAGARFAFHCWGTDLEVLASAHLGVCWPETVVEWLEYPVYSTETVQSMYAFPLAAEILREPLAIHGGELRVPAAPGLGVDIDESVVERYPWIDGPWSLFRLESPAQTYAVTSDHSIQWEGDHR
jgi:L-alanine-DL-glutamate epimerase-like enolase superfamily enzyme